MKTRSVLLLLLLLAGQIIMAQPTDNNNKYKNGYALKGKDTIWCKVAFDTKYEDARSAITLLINNDEASFLAGGPITGFGVEENGDKYEFGVVDVDVMLGNRRFNNPLFVKKLVAGTIDLYEYTYSLYSTKTTSINGEVQPGSTSSSQSYTNNYIAKTDSANTVLAKPVLLAAFRKKDLETYIGDNADLLARAEKRFSRKELIAALKEYNKWSLQKKKL